MAGAMSPLKTLRSWLGLDGVDSPEPAPLRQLVEALDRMDEGRARHLARVAYLLGRVAHADRHVAPEETRAMEALVKDEGGLSDEQAMLVVGLAKSSNRLFGGTADFLVAQEFAETANYDEKLALARCLFAVASSDDAISMAEETEIHRITNQLRILPEDLTRLRLEHRRFLPGLRKDDQAE
jgi:uncharacterized tellurite resistance protein B-like protein